MKSLFILMIMACMLSCNQNLPETPVVACGNNDPVVLTTTTTDQDTTSNEVILRTCIVLHKVYKYEKYWLIGECIDPGNVCQYYRIGQVLVLEVDENQYIEVNIGESVYGKWCKGVL